MAKKIKKAVALGYNKDKNNAPKVLASGKGEVAHKIIEAAKIYKVPIKEDSDSKQGRYQSRNPTKSI